MLPAGCHPSLAACSPVAAAEWSWAADLVAAPTAPAAPAAAAAGLASAADPVAAVAVVFRPTHLGSGPPYPAFARAARLFPAVYCFRGRRRESHPALRDSRVWAPNYPASSARSSAGRARSADSGTF